MEQNELRTESPVRPKRKVSEAGLKNLVNSPAERKRLVEEKRWKALRFLREHIFTSPSNLALAIGVNPSHVFRQIKRYEAEGLLTRHEIPFDGHGGQKLSLIGITQFGQIEACDYDAGERVSPRYYTPGRQSINRGFPHRMMLQRLQLSVNDQIERWIDGDGLIAAGLKWEVEKMKKPDAVMEIRRNGQLYRVAIEAERTIKTEARFNSAITRHYLAIRKRVWDMTLYITTTESRKKRLNVMVDNMKKIYVNGTDIDELNGYRKLVQFILEDDFPRVQERVLDFIDRVHGQLPNR